MAQPQQQQDLLKFQGKRIKDQSSEIAKQARLIEKLRKEQAQDKRNG